MTDNNIVQFPKNKIVRECINVEEVKKAQEKSLRNYADSVVDEVTNVLMIEIDNQGLDRDDEKFIRDFNFAVTVLAASIYRSLKVPHELHPFLDECVKTAEAIIKDGEELDF
jgi:transcriptional regulator NrdR family protein